MTAVNRRSVTLGLAIGLAVCAPWLFESSQAQQASRPAAPAIDADDIGGVVTGPNGPEAGVWVIAETRDLPVRYIKIVVTNDQGRYVIPDLPRARYHVWAAGYGLVDSAKSTSEPGRSSTSPPRPRRRRPTRASTTRRSTGTRCSRCPTASEMANREQFAGNMTQQRWLGAVKNLGCVGCHQLGQLSTRTIPASLGTFASGADAWHRRVQSGQAGDMMLGQLNGLGPGSFQHYGDWTDRVAKGELPKTRPSRPQGAERNIVVTLRDWMNEKQYLHDLISSDRRYPTVNGNGPLFGSPEYSSDVMPILDPSRTRRRRSSCPCGIRRCRSASVRDTRRRSSRLPRRRTGATRRSGTRAPTTTTRCSIATAACGWPRRCARRTTRVLPRGSSHPVGRSCSRSIATSGRSRCSSRRRRSTRSSTPCFGTHHVQFGYDADDTLWTSGGGPVLGWLNTKQFLKTGDAAASQGWTAFVLDTNGNGKRDEYVGAERSGGSGEGQARRDAVLLDHAEPDRWIDLGRRDGEPLAPSCAWRPDPIRRRPR
jgi:hypothetical protein